MPDLGRYLTVLRPEVLMKDGKPLLNDVRMNAFWDRLRTRLASVRANECTFTISADLAAHVLSILLDKDSSRTLTGDRTKLVLLVLPFLIRDLAYEEVIINFITLYSTFFYFILHIVLKSGWRIGSVFEQREVEISLRAPLTTASCNRGPFEGDSGKVLFLSEIFAQVRFKLIHIIPR